MRVGHCWFYDSAIGGLWAYLRELVIEEGRGNASGSGGVLCIEVGADLLGELLRDDRAAHHDRHTRKLLVNESDRALHGADRGGHERRKPDETRAGVAGGSHDGLGGDIAAQILSLIHI